MVIRRQQQIDDFGRTSIVPTTIPAEAVVVSSTPNDLQRLPEGETFDKAITLYSMFRLRGASPQAQPDRIVWHDTTYVVRSLEDFTGYGEGFVSAVAVSIESVEAPPQPDPTALPRQTDRK